MKYIDIENWERKEHFNFFRQFDYPHFNICGNVDITEFKKFVKERELSFFKAFLYVSVRTANEIKEFRYRIRGDKVVEHESVSPSFTLMTNKGVFRFCAVNYNANFKAFLEKTESEMKKNEDEVNLEDEPDRDDLLFITSIPWVSFTNITHPISMHPVDCIPRISWGKYFDEGGRLKLPLSVQVHHALADGFHVGQYFNLIQEILDNPCKYLDA